MNPKVHKTPYKRIVLIISLCLMIIWCILGTGASLAWFTDTSPEINNIFHFADFKPVVSHRLSDGNWEQVDGQTEIFDNSALYEPGYVQTVYLRVENKGSTEFKFSTAVNVNGYTTATNVYGDQFTLYDYLKFGVAYTKNLAELDSLVPSREVANSIATLPLHNYATDTFVLAPNEAFYIALIVRMPSEVTNVANYRELPVPYVELGITVRADQVNYQ